MLHLVYENKGNICDAEVSIATCTLINATWNSYVLIHHLKSHQQSIFRLKIVEKTDTDNSIRIHSQWKHTYKTEDIDEDNDYQVQVEVVPSSQIQVIEYIEVVPVAKDQPRLATPFLQRLLGELILMKTEGIVQLKKDEIDYGEWQYRAYSKRKSTVSDIGGGIVGPHTQVTILPFFISSTSSISVQEKQMVPSHMNHIKELFAMTLDPFKRSHLINSAVMSFQSILLVGPSGSGKSTTMKILAQHFGAHLLILDAALMSSPALKIEEFFTAAVRLQPCILLFEDIELIFPRHLDDIKLAVVSQLAMCLEYLRSAQGTRVVVAGTVSDVRSLHVKIRQLFSEELNIEMPSKRWSKQFFASFFPQVSFSDEFLNLVVVRYGQQPSNLTSICQYLLASKTEMLESNSNATKVDEKKLMRKITDFALKLPKATKFFTATVPDVTWEDLGGLDTIKQLLIEMIVWPLEKPQVFHRMGISPPSGMLLHGPPGTGKTMLAKAAARASGCNFLNLSASDLMKAEFGESEKAIANAFDAARALSPCMIFIDEFQSLFGSRSTAGVTTCRMISQLLIEMDSLKLVAEDLNKYQSNSNHQVELASRVFVLAATNCLSAIDQAFLQPGRFENVVYVGLPTPTQRRSILELQGKRMPWSNEIDLEYLVNQTDGANAASLVALCQAAAIDALRSRPAQAIIQMENFQNALKRGNFDFKPSFQSPLQFNFSSASSFSSSTTKNFFLP